MKPLTAVLYTTFSCTIVALTVQVGSGTRHSDQGFLLSLQQPAQLPTVVINQCYLTAMQC